jgi:hypothetical protein
MQFAMIAQGLAVVAGGNAAWRWYESTNVEIRVGLEIGGHVYEGQPILDVYGLDERKRPVIYAA